MIFWKKYSIAFKAVIIDSEALNVSVDTNEIVIAQVLNKNQWTYHKKALT